MRGIVLALVSAVMASGCGVVNVMKHAHVDVKGSGVAKSEERQVGDFKRIVLAGSADIVATVGPVLKVVVEGDDNIVALITTLVEDDTLIIKSDESYSTDKPVRITITAPAIEGIEIFGAGDARIEGVKAEQFDASIAGAGDITVVGSATHVTASIRGSGDIDLEDLTATIAEASISGSGDISIHATKSLDASIKGSGDIRYYGKPGTVSRSILGSGDIDAG